MQGIGTKPGGHKEQSALAAISTFTAPVRAQLPSGPEVRLHGARRVDLRPSSSARGGCSAYLAGTGVGPSRVRCGYSPDSAGAGVGPCRAKNGYCVYTAGAGVGRRCAKSGYYAPPAVVVCATLPRPPPTPFCARHRNKPWGTQKTKRLRDLHLHDARACSAPKWSRRPASRCPTRRSPAL